MVAAQQEEQDQKVEHQHSQKSKTSNLAKKKKVLFLFLFIAILSTAALILGAYVQFERTSIFSHTDDPVAAGLSFATNYYLESPALIGDTTAPVTLHYVIDFESAQADEFFQSTLPQLQENFIDTGRTKLAFKYFLVESDLQEQTQRYKKAKFLSCYIDAGGQNALFYAKYLAETDTLADDFGPYIDAQVLDMAQCMEKTPENLLYDSAESEHFKIQAPSYIVHVATISPTIVSGNSDMDTLEEEIRVKEIGVGI